MFFSNIHVSLRHGVDGRQLAVGLKALNDRLMPLYESLDIPFGPHNRYCVCHAAFTWGCMACGPDHILSEQDFSGRTPGEFDSYRPPPLPNGLSSPRLGRLHISKRGASMRITRHVSAPRYTDLDFSMGG